MSGNRSFPGYLPGSDNVGADISSATPNITHPVHKVVTTATLTTLTPPLPDNRFIGPLYLKASSVFSWTSSGNIAVGPGTTLVAGRAYGFIYVKADAKWSPFGQDS